MNFVSGHSIGMVAGRARMQLICARVNILLATALLIALLPTAADLHAAPVGQNNTFERWVQVGGDDSGNCTRTVDDQGTDETDDDVYVYDACETITRALEVANAGDVIRVAGPFTYNESLVITKSITIIGGYAPGFGQEIEPESNPQLFPTTIDGIGSAVDIQTGFIVDPNSVNLDQQQVTLRGLRFVAGSSGSGGGILIRQVFPFAFPFKITLDNVLISGNSATANGGGINISDTSQLTIQNSRFTGNSAGNWGGGIFATGGATVSLKDATIFTSNSATANGGAIAASGNVTITLSGGITLTSNSAAGAGGGVYNSQGILDIGSGSYFSGNSAAHGGAFYANGGRSTVSGSLFETNNAGPDGGALYLTNNAAATLTDSEILSNTSTSHGAGLYIANTQSVTATALTFVNNQVTNGQGGGAYVSSSTAIAFVSNTFLQNRGNRGGGLYATAASVRLNGNSFSLNQANKTGGGIHFENADGSTADGDTFSLNQSPAGGGAYINLSDNLSLNALLFDQNISTGHGGGGSLLNSTNVFFTSPTFSDNTAANHGGGLFVSQSSLTIAGATTAQKNIAGSDGSGNGGAFYLSSASSVAWETTDLIDNTASHGGGLFATGSTISVSGAAGLQGNQATNGNGGGIYVAASSAPNRFSELVLLNNEASNHGGGLFATGSTFTIGTIDSQSNRANAGSGGGLYLGGATATVTDTFTLRANQAEQQGGGIYTNNSTLTIQAPGVIDDNEANTGSGGGAYLNNGGGARETVDLGSITFSDNSASQHGGGLFISGLTLIMGDGSQLLNNRTLIGNGGGLYSSGTNVAMQSATIQNNSGHVDGGGLYVLNGSLTLLANTSVHKNKATLGSGGGAFVHNGSLINIQDSAITENSAGIHGAGLYVKDSGLTLSSANLLQKNVAASGNGGAVHATGGTATLSNATISQNTAAGGAGLYLAVDTATLANNTIENNEAVSGQGAGGWLSAQSLRLGNNLVNQNVAALDGGGLVISDTGTAALFANEISDNDAGGNGGGMMLVRSSAAIDRSTLYQNHADGDAGGIYALFSRVAMTNSLVVANTISLTDAYAAGIYVANDLLRLDHNTIANNSHTLTDGFSVAIYVDAPQPAATPGEPEHSELTLANNIISGHDIGLDLLPGNSATAQATLWNNTLFDWTGEGDFLSVTDNVTGDPRFVAAASGDFRIEDNSAAREIGISSAIRTDKEGTTRPQGFLPDAGAYEVAITQGLFMQASASPLFVKEGDEIRYRVRLLNDGAVDLTGVRMTVRLPNEQPSPTIDPGSCSGIFCDAQLGTIPVGAERIVTLVVAAEGPAAETALVNMIANVNIFGDNLGAAGDSSASLRTYLHTCLAQVGTSIHNSVQAAVNAAADGQTIRISGYCGGYNDTIGPGQLAAINKNLTLQGGWNSIFTVRDPAATPTTLDAAGTGRVLYIAPNATVTAEDLVLRNGSAAGLNGGENEYDAGGGIFVKSGNLVLNNVEVANGFSPGVGGGIYLQTSSSPAITNATIRNNTAGIWGGGIYARETNAIFTDVTASGNAAAGGGGLYFVGGEPVLTVSSVNADSPSCQIIANQSLVAPYYEATVTMGERTRWLSPGGGGGLVLENSNANIQNCLIANNTSLAAGGILVHRSAASIQDNIIRSNRAFDGDRSFDGFGGGIVVDRLANRPPRFNSNALLFNRSIEGAALVAMLHSGDGWQIRHNTIAHHVGASAVLALNDSSLALLDSILALNEGAAIVARTTSAVSTAQVSLTRTLWHANGVQTATDGAGASISTAVDIVGDPAFKDDGFHIKRISAAYGQGVAQTQLADIDGDQRPLGGITDLGADEYDRPGVVRYVAPGGAGTDQCLDYLDPCATIQAAIDAAETGDTIKLAGSTYSQMNDRNGTSQVAFLDKTVMIQGGYYPRTNDNDETDGLFTLYDWEDPHPETNPTTIDAAVQGRGLYIASATGDIEPVVRSLIVRNGAATGLSGGVGGLDAGGNVYVDGVSPRFEDVLIERGRAALGAGLYVSQVNATLSQITVDANTASLAGGGLYVNAGALNLTGATIRNNTAITGAGGYFATPGAAIISNTFTTNGGAQTQAGGGLYILAGTAPVIDNVLTSNTAGAGAGLYLDDSDVNVQTNRLEDNIATDPQGGRGGGLFVTGGAPQIEENRIRNNQAVGAAGGVGGGVYFANTGANFQANLVQNNQAQKGGGLYIGLASGALLSSNVLVSNRADEEETGKGGGVYLDASTAELRDNTIQQNSAYDGGGFYAANDTASHIASNVVVSNTATRHGGGSYIDQSGPTLVENLIQANSTAEGSGGGLYLAASTSSLTENRIKSNTATLNGGGIYLASDTSQIRGGSLQLNRATSGGGLYDHRLSATDMLFQPPRVEETAVVSNTATNNGGGIYVRQGGGRFMRLAIVGNSAGQNGGGVYIEETSLARLERSLVRHNAAASRGGGVAIHDQSQMLLAGNAIVDNVAGTDAGGIYIAGSSPTLVHTTLARNGVGAVAETAESINSQVTLINTIIAGHETVGLQADQGNRFDLDSVLWDANQTDFLGPGVVNPVRPLSGAASFSADGYHIQFGSDAVGRAVTTMLAPDSDIDGEGRIQGTGPELGADEISADCIVVVSPNFGVAYSHIQDAIDAAPNNGEIRVAGACSGVRARAGTLQVAWIDKNLTIRGGFLPGDWESSDPEAYPTVLDASRDQQSGRVLYLQGVVRVALEDLIISGGDATGQGGVPGSDAGGNLFGNGAQLTVRGGRISGGRADIGGGLYLRTSALTLENIAFLRNHADLYGGAIYLTPTDTSISLRQLQFTENDAGSGGALYLNGGSGTIAANSFDGNSATGEGGAIYCAACSSTLSNNTINANFARLGAGIYVHTAADAAGPDIYNSIITHNSAGEQGAALYLSGGPGRLRHLTLAANTTGQAEGAALFVAPGEAESFTVQLVNNIVVNHTIGVSVSQQTELVAQANLWNANGVNWAGPGLVTVANGNRFDELPGFVDTTTRNYRLRADSPAIDRGISAEIFSDIDGQPRPGQLGFDIGADEYLAPALSATLTPIPNPVAAGDHLTLIVRLTNNGDVDLLGDVTLTLPLQVSTTDATRWTDVVIARGASWTTNVVVTVDGAFIGELAFSLNAETDQGASAADTATATVSDVAQATLEISGVTTPDPVAAGATADFSLRLVNRGAVPLSTTVEVILPPQIATEAALIWRPLVTGGNGVWTTRFPVTVAPTATGELFSQILVQSASGESAQSVVGTTIAEAKIDVVRVTLPNPVTSGALLNFRLEVTNTGNVALNATISNSLPLHATPLNPQEEWLWNVPLEPGERWTRTLSATIEVGFAGSLASTMYVATDLGLTAVFSESISVQIPQLDFGASARGGDWHNPTSWDPQRVPSPSEAVYIPPGVTMFVSQPVTVGALRNDGTIRLQRTVTGDQSLTVRGPLENDGLIIGASGVTPGEPGMTIILNAGSFYNTGEVRSGDGAPDAGAGGDIRVQAENMTNQGRFVAGDGAAVTDPATGIPGGPGGNVIVTVSPGLLLNLNPDGDRASFQAGRGGDSHTDGEPPQPGGAGGLVSLLSTAAVILDGTEVVAGSGGDGTPTGEQGAIVVGAPNTSVLETTLSGSTVRIVSTDDTEFAFAAFAPKVALVRVFDGLTQFPVTIVNLGARTDTYVIGTQGAPDSWQDANLPTTLRIDSFSQNQQIIQFYIPLSELAAAQNRTVRIVVYSRTAPDAQVILDVPLRTGVDLGAVLHLPLVSSESNATLQQQIVRPLPSSPHTQQTYLPYVGE